MLSMRTLHTSPYLPSQLLKSLQPESGGINLTIIAVKFVIVKVLRVLLEGTCGSNRLRALQSANPHFIVDSLILRLLTPCSRKKGTSLCSLPCYLPASAKGDDAHMINTIQSHVTQLFLTCLDADPNSMSSVVRNDPSKHPRTDAF